MTTMRPEKEIPVASRDDDELRLSMALLSILQTAHVSLDLPKNDEVWSRWYSESEDKFADFRSYEPAPPSATMPASGGSLRSLSARQISGQFDDEVAKSWEEDWEDEDVEDTLDFIMGNMSRIEASTAAKAAQL